MQDGQSESAAGSNDPHAAAADASAIDSQTGATSIPTYISTDPTALSYYNYYYQQALAAGQDVATAGATALTAYTAWANYAGYAASAAAVDPSASSKYSQAYNSVPPPNQIMAGTTIAPASTATTIPSTAYGYAMPSSTMAPSGNYSAVYAAYYGYGAVGAQPPPPPE